MRLLLVATLVAFFVGPAMIGSATAEEVVRTPFPSIADGSNMPQQAPGKVSPQTPIPSRAFRQPLGRSFGQHGHSGYHGHYHGHSHGVTVYQLYTPGYYSTFGYTTGYPVYSPYPPGYVAYPNYYRPYVITPRMVLPRW